MGKDRIVIKDESLLGCNYVGKNHCAQIGSCQIQAFLKNLEDLGDTKEANSRRNKLKKQAKSKKCKCLPLE